MELFDGDDLSPYKIEEHGNAMELVHTPCGLSLCRAEQDDTLLNLARVAAAHVCEAKS